MVCRREAECTYEKVQDSADGNDVPVEFAENSRSLARVLDCGSDSVGVGGSGREDGGNHDTIFETGIILLLDRCRVRAVAVVVVCVRHGDKFNLRGEWTRWWFRSDSEGEASCRRLAVVLLNACRELVWMQAAAREGRGGWMRRWTKDKNEELGGDACRSL